MIWTKTLCHRAKKLLDKVAEELIGLRCYSSYLIEKIDLELSDQLRNL